MSLGRSLGAVSIQVALLLCTVLLAPPVLAQVNAGKQRQPEAIPSTRQALEGRLFFSREQRERLDRARAGGEIVNEETAIEPPASRINGFVKRSDGETAVWVDGRARYGVAGEKVERLQPQDVGGNSGKVRILSEDSRKVSNLEGRGIITKARPKSKNKRNTPHLSTFIDGRRPR